MINPICLISAINTFSTKCPPFYISECSAIVEVEAPHLLMSDVSNIPAHQEFKKEWLIRISRSCVVVQRVAGGRGLPAPAPDPYSTPYFHKTSVLYWWEPLGRAASPFSCSLFTFTPSYNWLPSFRIWEMVKWGIFTIHTIATPREPWISVRGYHGSRRVSGSLSGGEGSTPRLYYHLPVPVPTRRRRGVHQPTVIINSENGFASVVK